jgi:hypothetical protein
MSEQQRIFDSLKDKGPEEWDAYLRPIEAERTSAGLSMQVAFDHAAKLARDQSSLEWAGIALRAADLEKKHSPTVVQESIDCKAMMLRAKLIAAIGSRMGHAILGKETLVRWHTDDLGISPDMAIVSAMSIWPELREAKESGDQARIDRVGEEMRSLRRIKNRLNVLKLLAECGEMANEPVVNEWLNVREQLP